MQALNVATKGTDGSKSVCCFSSEIACATAFVVGNVKQHSWLGYYITLPPGLDGKGQDEGSGQIEEVSEQTLELMVSRHVDEDVHEDLYFTNFAQRPIEFRFELELDGDFADQDELQKGGVALPGNMGRLVGPRRAAGRQFAITVPPQSRGAHRVSGIRCRNNLGERCRP